MVNTRTASRTSSTCFLLRTKVTNMQRKTRRLPKMNSVFSVKSFSGGTCGMYTCRAWMSDPTRTNPISANRMTWGVLMNQRSRLKHT